MIGDLESVDLTPKIMYTMVPPPPNNQKNILGVGAPSERNNGTQQDLNISKKKKNWYQWDLRFKILDPFEMYITTHFLQSRVFGSLSGYRSDK